MKLTTLCGTALAIDIGGTALNGGRGRVFGVKFRPGGFRP